jgi:hypothetical protein
MPTIYGISANGEAVINRVINAFKNLKAIANENNVRSTPHMFDDAELSGQSEKPVVMTSPNPSCRRGTEYKESEGPLPFGSN